MTVESVTYDALDNIAKMALEIEDAYAHSTTLWSIIDGSGVENFENAVKGSFVSDLDAWLEDPHLALAERITPFAWTLTSHAASAGYEYSFEGANVAVAEFDELLGYYMCRISQWIAELLPNQPTKDFVFPKGSGYASLVGPMIGSFTYGGSLDVGGADGQDTDWVSQSRIVFTAINTGANPWILTPTVKFASGDTAAPNFTIAGSTSGGTERPAESTLAANAAVGQHVIQISDEQLTWVNAGASYADCVLLATAQTGEPSTELVRVKALVSALNNTTVTLADPGEVLSVAHGLVDGDQVTLTDSQTCVPNVDGTYTITKIDADNFSIPVNVTTGGSCDISAYIIALDVLRNAWTTSHYVCGLYENITAISESGGQAADNTNVYTAVDRIVSL